MTLNLTKPLRGNPRVSRGFVAHAQTHPGTWYGIDFAVDTGTELIACETGSISHSVKDTSGGGWCFILHFDKYPGWMAWYAHCSQIPNNGERFNRGQGIGRSGATGGVTGPHLHFSILHQEGNIFVPKDPDDRNIVVWEGGDEPMISDVDNEFSRWNKLFVQIRGRNATRDEFKKSAVGQTWLRAMEILSDDAEADRNEQSANIGRKAQSEDWAGQIKSLRAEIDTIKKTYISQEKFQELQEKVASDYQAVINKLSKDLTTSEGVIFGLQQDYNTARQEAVDRTQELRMVEKELKNCYKACQGVAAPVSSKDWSVTIVWKFLKDLFGKKVK